MFRLLPASLLLVAVASGGGCGAEAPDPPASQGAFDTPEAVFAAFVQATREDDLAGAIGLLSEESQAMMIAGLLMSASLMTMGDEASQRSLDELIRKHVDLEGDPEPGAGDAGPEAMVRSSADLPAFVGELSEWLDEHGDGSASGFVEIGELGEVSVAGDEATAFLETEMGTQPVEFRRVEGSWVVHLPSGPAEADLGEYDPDRGPGAADDDAPGLGAIWIDDRPFRLHHATAYRSTFFGEPCTVVLLTAREISQPQRGKLKTMLAAGGDDEFFVGGPNLKLTLDESGELVSLFAWADNLSINGEEGTEVAIRVDGDRVRGSATMAEPGEIFDSTYRFEAEFDTQLVSPGGPP